MYGILASAFDPFPHPGAISAMRQAIDEGGCESIIALLHIDPSVERPEKRRPVISDSERMAMVGAIKYVSKVILYRTEDDLRVILELLTPHVRVLGDDYIGKRFTGDDLGQKVFYARRVPGWSGTEFMRRINDASLDDGRKRAAGA